MHHTLNKYVMLALSILGSATLLFSCSSKHSSVEYDTETLMTELSENRTIDMVENGVRSYTFSAPLIEGYSLAQNPYQEFRKGIKMTTYTSDSLSLIDATITANYAIYYDKQKLWEAKGNVVIIKHNRKGKDTTVVSNTEVYTQQLFWDARTKKIYSNVDTKVLQPDGWHFGVGFEADEDLKNIHFRKYKSEMEFDFSPVEEHSDDATTSKDENTQRPNQRPRADGRPKPRTPSAPKTFNPSTTQSSTATPMPARGNSRQMVGGDKATLSTSVSADVTAPKPGGAMQRPSTPPSAQRGASSKVTTPATQSKSAANGTATKTKALEAKPMQSTK